MSHVVTSLQPRPAIRAGTQDGPVLLATRPVNGRDAPLAVARWLATREDRPLEVVTVLQQGDTLGIAAGMTPLPSAYYEAEREQVADRLRTALSTADPQSTTLRVDVLEGPTAQAVVDAARARRARVIVIGTGGHDAIGRHIFGEHALQLLAIADRPVLIVSADAIAGAVHTGVVAMDFTSSSIRAAHAMLPMLSAGSCLHLVHVRTATSLREEMAGWPADMYEPRCKAMFRSLLRELPSLPGVSVVTRIIGGDPADVIVKYASSCSAGMIACGRLDHTFLERLFVRSVSSDVVRRAGCPVLVVPDLHDTRDAA
ncbi:MAG: UspA protein [Gemmatimonadetes bacterium]|jgi:nucleotide-binding universal stress UspA family protein|nr:UspA protein [Gemmatimonadota bacterium]